MEWLKISTSVELVRVLTDDIVFIQADGNYSNVYMVNGKPHTMTFKLHYFDDVFQKLHNNLFVRVGKSLIVNKNYICVINLTKQEIILTNPRMREDFKLKASKDALKDLKTLLEREEGKS